jgi:hypothetical protein
MWPAEGAFLGLMKKSPKSIDGCPLLWDNGGHEQQFQQFNPNPDYARPKEGYQGPGKIAGGEAGPDLPRRAFPVYPAAHGAERQRGQIVLEGPAHHVKNRETFWDGGPRARMLPPWRTRSVGALSRPRPRRRMRCRTSALVLSRRRARPGTRAGRGVFQSAEWGGGGI